MCDYWYKRLTTFEDDRESKHIHRCYKRTVICRIVAADFLWWTFSIGMLVIDAKKVHRVGEYKTDSDWSPVDTPTCTLGLRRTCPLNATSNLPKMVPVDEGQKHDVELAELAAGGETQLKAENDHDFVYVPNTAAERALVRKIDLHLLPILWLMYVFNYIDRSNIGVSHSFPA